MATAKQFAKMVNGVNVDNLFTTIDAIKAAPTIAKFNFRIENRWEGAGQNRSTVNAFYGAGQEISRQKSFILHADEPPVLLGDDSAANPVEYLLHSLAACLTTSMVYHAAARGIEIEEVESSFEGDIDLHGFLDLDPKVRKGYQGIRAMLSAHSTAVSAEIRRLSAAAHTHTLFGWRTSGFTNN